MRRRFMFKNSRQLPTQIPNNEIWYTSNNGKVVNPFKTSVFGANIVSNTYENDKGVITFDGDVTSIGTEAFYFCILLTSITIPDSVTEIGNSAFSDCPSLTSVIIGNGVTSIGSDAFYYCDSLTSITIPDSVTSIGNGAFDNCISLTNITIPDSVTSIGGYAFTFCSSLARVYCKPTTPPSGQLGMFDGINLECKIYVPTESVDAYKAADYWSDYANYIEGYDFSS